MSGDPKTQEQKNTVACNHKCRIPQRLPPVRRISIKSKPPTTESAKNKTDQPLNPVKCPNRPRSSESRPKSANRATDNVNESSHPATTTRTAKPERERFTKSSPVHKRTLNEKIYDVTSNKAGRHVITVPVKQKMMFKTAYNSKLSANLPDQETIRKCEELELQQEDFSDAAQMYNSINDIFLGFDDEESVTSRSDKMIQLKNCWQEKIVQFEEMKNDLNDRQNGILEVYAALRNTKQKLILMGEKADLPSTDDLRIMNVANMTPNQLLQLCAETKCRKDDKQLTKNTITIDMKKFNEMPLKLVATCEQTLATRKELIDWFDKLKNQKEGCPRSCLSKKINEFNTENEMLNSTLQTVKNEFLKQLNDFIRTCWNERVGLQLRNEELIYEVSALNSQNGDLKKQLYNAEKQKSQNNKIKIEGLEKQLQEEKVKKITMRDRLSRAEGQVKILDERASLLETTLNQARTQTRTLERTIQQLHEQNQQLQKDFDDELNKLREYMRKNTIRLEEIATAREILQKEKEDLKKKLEELSNHHNESVNTMKQDLSKSIAKLIDAEKKCNEEIENKESLQKTVESQCAHLQEYELRLRDAMKQLKETERISNDLLNYKKDTEHTKQELDATIDKLEEHKKRITEQSAQIMKMEHKLKISHELEKELKNEINNKEEYIAALEKKEIMLQQQSQENECKMERYEEQLSTLKNQIRKLQEHLIEFENLNELRDLINDQNTKLAETSHKNDELTEELQKKQNKLKHVLKTIAEQEDLIQQRQNVLQMLCEKEEEQSNILQLNQIISEKNSEIESLITNVETRKKQISQLEKIILTIEDQNHKGAIQIRKDQETIHNLEKKVAEYEYYIQNKKELAPPENLDNLIKILENELGTPFESQLINTNYTNANRRNENVDYHNECKRTDGRKDSCQPESKAMPTKIVMGNYVKKTYISGGDDISNNDSLHRKQAITNIDTQKWTPALNTQDTLILAPSFAENNSFFYANGREQMRHPKEKLLKDLQYTMHNQVKDEKKCKMFKFASHRLA